MNNNLDSEDDLAALLTELSGFEPSTKTREIVQAETKLEETDVQAYFLNKTKTLIDTTLAAVQDIAPSVASGGDAKDVEGLAKLMAAAAQTLDVLQRSTLIDKKANRDEQLEMLRQAGKKELAQLKSPQHVTNNNILVATREEIMKNLCNIEEK